MSMKYVSTTGSELEITEFKIVLCTCSKALTDPCNLWLLFIITIN